MEENQKFATQRTGNIWRISHETLQCS